MTDTQRAIIDAIQSFHAEHGYTPRQDWIAKETGYELVTIKKNVYKLKAKGLLSSPKPGVLVIHRETLTN
jgi:DNA-binding MarR family transcriptional regulator